MHDRIQDHSDIKEKIINTTISLIQHSDGLVENITVRDIAQKANVAVGLINYHFDSKKNLIEMCVQRIISHVMKTFSGTEESVAGETVNEKDSTDIASFTTSVFAFLIKNPEISKISMLGDLSHPNAESNSSVSYRAILKAIANIEPEKIRRIKAFMLLSTIQSAFLNRQVSQELLGLNLNVEKDYAHFFRLVTNILNIN